MDQILTVLLTTEMFVGGCLAFILDNTVPGMGQPWEENRTWLVLSALQQMAPESELWPGSMQCRQGEEQMAGEVTTGWMEKLLARGTDMPQRS